MSTKNKPIRTVLRWQVYVTGALALVAGIWAGKHGAISAVFGGLTNIFAGLVYGLIVSRVGVTSAGNVLRTVLRAEASKIILIVLQLWLVLTLYKSINAVVFFTSFIITVLVNSMAMLVRED